MRNVRSLSLLALVALGVACSGGGSSTPSGAPAPKVPGTPAPASGHRATVTLKLTIPARSRNARVSRAGERRPAYISPATLGAILTATSTSGNAADDESYGYDLSTAGVCTGGDGSPLVCTLSFPLYADTYSINVKAYDANEDGVSPGAGSPAAPAGNELSVDTESETVVLGDNNFFTNFLLHAVVNAFTVLGRANFGATGGTPFPSPLPTAQFAALDADSFNVDAYGNTTTYANGPFTASVTQLGDTTNCATACVAGTNDKGNTGASTATVDQASDELFTISYTGGGGPGSGVKSWTPGTAPSGQPPYSGSVVVTGPHGSGSATVLPLFSWPLSLTITNGAVNYVWAAQAAPPTGANPSTGSYTAYFGTPGTTTCMSNFQTVATVGAGTYYPGYGEVFPVTPGVNGPCTLTLSDGGTPADTVNVSMTVGTPGGTVTVPCPQGTYAPTGASRVRRLAVSRAATGPAPALVQYAVGAAQAILPNPVTAGNTLVVIIGDVPAEGAPSSSSYSGTFSEFGGADSGDIFVYTSDVPTSQNIGALLSNDTLNGCAAVMWVGEFSGTSSTVIQEANANSGGTSSATTPSIVTNALNGLVITSDVTQDTTAATASAGYAEYFVYGAAPYPTSPPYSSLDVQLATTPTTDDTASTSNTFGGAAAEGDTDIFQIPPTTFTPSPGESPDPGLHPRPPKVIRR